MSHLFNCGKNALNEDIIDLTATTRMTLEMLQVETTELHTFLIKFWPIYDIRRYQNVDLGLYLENGQSVVHYRHRIFLLGIFCQRMDIFRHFTSLNPKTLQLNLDTF